MQSEEESEHEIEPESFTPRVITTATPKQRLHKEQKSILKPSEKSHEDDESLSNRKSLARGVRDKLARDDNEIAALEKKLGLKGKRKLPKAFEDEGLDVLMDGLDRGLDGGSDDSERREESAWLERKRRKARGESERQSGLDLEDQISSSTAPSSRSREDDDDDNDDEVDFSGLDSDTSESLDEAPRVRENPYVAPHHICNCSC